MRWPAALRPYSSRRRRRLGVDVERLAGLGGTDEAVRPLIKRIHRLQAVGLFLGVEVVVDGVEHGTAGGEALVVDAAGQRQILDVEIAGGRIGAEAKRGVSR